MLMALLETLVARPAPIRKDDAGVWRIGKTRVRLETVIEAFRAGSAAEEILLKYPSLELMDIYAVITYYLWHRDEVDEYLEKSRTRTEEVRRENEERFPPGGVR